ncbi:miaB [Symbiodinium necroappetens]|uniref:MiaB protein n=1 Tax=Symbiodinium necroappetens TaxID=1628268 RepID=A0A812W9N9_9DINO|nr:miaB [Symbiodinium necroappetens]
MPDRTVYLETFGCQMNELDSELVAGQLTALGYRLTGEADAADVVLYNTCSVRDLAEQKVRSRLGEIRLRKAEEPGLVVGVLGCMAERDGEDLIRKFPVVDVLCGPAELDKLPGLLDNAVRTRESLVADAGDEAVLTKKNGRTVHASAERSAKVVALQGDSSRRSSTLAAAGDSLEMLDLSRAVSPHDHDGSAYVRITRGCNKFCTYCVVPHTRGAEIHRPPDHIVDECKRLADAGIVEVTLLGQTVNHYRFEHGSSVSVSGVTQPQKGRTYKGSHHRDVYAGERVTTFADLLKRIHDEAPGIQRLRFVTSYPRDFGNDVLEVMRDSPRICRYLHIPAQSGSNEVLARMNRGYTVEEYLEFLDRARHFLDEPEKGRPLMLAGDMIVGFCGETEADFEASKELLRKARYKNCFIFKYSPRPGTTAYDRIADDVSEADKRRRCNELLAVQHEISHGISESLVGSVQHVFVQGVSEYERKRAKAADNGMISLTVGGRSDLGSTNAAVLERASGPVQMTGRTDGDLIVVFDCPESRSATGLIGRVVPVRIARANVLTLFGELV